MALVACAAPPDVIGIDDPTMPAETVPGATRHEIFIATSRLPSSEPGQFFSKERSAELALASVTVSIPPNHTPGEITRPKRVPPDATTEFVVYNPRSYANSQRFLAAVNAGLSVRGREDQDVLLFVHGFNNTLSDAVLRVAQFVEDSDFGGVPVLFSWASAGRISDYVYDLNSVLAARPLLEETARILIQSNSGGFNIFAHSMGTLLVSETIARSGIRGDFGTSGKIQSIMLAAPDIDVDVFRSQLKEIDKPIPNMFLLISRDDSALAVSRRIAGGVDRVGAAEIDELTDLGVVVIDLSKITDSSDGTHSKFSSSPEVVQLVGQTLDQHGFSEKLRSSPLQDVLEILPGGDLLAR